MDSVLYWNDVALEANRVSHTNGAGEQTGPPLSARALAIVHLAVYDAFAGVVDDPINLPLYLPTLSVVAQPASASSAVAAAAHTTLSALFPTQKAFFDTSLAEAPISGTAAEITAGRAYGTSTAHGILADRGGDPGVGATGYVNSGAPGHHRDDPDNPGGVNHAPFYGAAAKCFAVTARHALAKPPIPGDVAYADALAQVRGKGIAPQLMGTVPAGIEKRMPIETLIGLFWAYDGSKGLGTPPRFYNTIVRRVAASQVNSEAQNARLFALLNVAMADAGILAWEQKYRWDVWRPVVAIREDDPSMGPQAIPGSTLSSATDPGWLPLGSPATNDTKKKNFTPPFPGYPSGHATFGAAAFQVTRRFYGVAANGPDALGVEVMSDELNGVNTDNTGAVRPRHLREFPDGLWGMIRENSISRVFLGVHWVFDGFLPAADGSMDLTQNIGGVPLGLAIADDIFDSGMAKSTV